jgi:hypothetical protein
MSHSGQSQDGQQHHLEEELDDEQVPEAQEDDIIYLEDEEIEAMD